MRHEAAEAVTAPTVSAGWALILVCAHGMAWIAASSFSITTGVDQVSPDPDDLGLPFSESDPGFWLWEGAVCFDGLDGIEYEGSARKLTFSESEVWMVRHEAEPPSEAEE